ncbi:hypothetical protein VSDG_03336 [Cytospora chrysosperma]|uniref:K Homology domain-containing protein n=1 Tax=Cytospora chrysosperma TaxID=252740 RepID=A0A423WBF1_CYTCH|nr:hypothetical protein VSDG_03336 [Valsa sordida]
MAGATPDIQAILEQLRATQSRPSTTTPTQGQPGLPAPAYSQPSYAMPPMGAAPTQAANYPPAGQYQYPQPSSSGTVDLSAIKPVSSGSVSLQDAIAKAKAVAAANNLAPYERLQSLGGSDGHRHSGSRSPTHRREAFHENYNPYRDERRSDDRPPRGYGRDRSYSPGPRGRQGSGGAFSPRAANSARQRSPLRGDDDNASETMQIEASLVGLIIGRQGENLRRVEGETKCRVQFLAPSTGDEKFRQCKVTGPRARRAEAKAAINRIIDDSGMGAIARAGLDRGSRPPPERVVPAVINLKDGEDCLQIMVPDRTVGLIIGRGGETIRDLQERSGCHINIVGESKSVNGLRPVNLIGPYAATAQAKDLIMEIVDSDSRSTNAANPPQQGRGNPRDNGGLDKVNDAIFVPNEAVGMIIGKGGETIREMQNTTGCKINVSQQPRPGEHEREIELVGTRDAINRAKQSIEDKVEAVRQKSNGGGGGGGGGGAGARGRGHHRDYDNPNYGQQQPSNPQQSVAPAAQAGADGQADPYAAYGGYQNYLALWYQSLAAQQQAAGGQGDGSKPPGTL